MGLLLSLMLIALDQTSARFHRGVVWARVLVTPFRVLAREPGELFSSLIDHWRSQSVLLKENQRLQKALQLANTERARLKAALTQGHARQVAALFQPHFSVPTHLAWVLSSQPQASHVTLGQGTADHLAVGMAVISPAGVLGQLVSVWPTHATLALLTAKTVAVPVVDARSQVVSVTQGDGTRVQLAPLATTSDVRVGDVFQTSGLGGVYPKGVPVATVTAIEPRAVHPFLRVTLTPFAQVSASRAVLVMGGAS
jgi:rod shape-determining protein MreC